MLAWLVPAEKSPYVLAPKLNVCDTLVPLLTPVAAPVKPANDNGAKYPAVLVSPLMVKVPVLVVLPFVLLIDTIL